MKSNSQPLFHPPSNGLKAVIQALRSDASPQDHSPYLKAILSGQTKSPVADHKTLISTPDRDAALRYIRESKLLKKYDSNHLK